MTGEFIDNFNCLAYESLSFHFQNERIYRKQNGLISPVFVKTQSSVVPGDDTYSTRTSLERTVKAGRVSKRGRGKRPGHPDLTSSTEEHKTHRPRLLTTRQYTLRDPTRVTGFLLSTEGVSLLFGGLVHTLYRNFSVHVPLNHCSHSFILFH